MIRQALIFYFFSVIFLQAQKPDWKRDFVFAESSSDTVYLAPDEFLEDSYLVFHSKEELYQHFANVNFDKTGEIFNEYQFSIEETPARYIAKDGLVLTSYRNFCSIENKNFPDTFNVNNLDSLEETEREKFLDYLSRAWEIPVNFHVKWTASPSIEIIITETDWKKKEFLIKANQLLSKAFPGNPPLCFTFKGAEFKNHEAIPWGNFHVEIRKQNELILKTNSDEEISFPFTENQYSYMADFHVNFLSFYKIMLDN